MIVQEAVFSGQLKSFPLFAGGFNSPFPPCGGRLGWGVNISKARELRKNPTNAEQALWKHLRMRQIGGYKFRRQQPIGPYIVDFVSFEREVIIEVDGGQHSQQTEYDAERTAWLNAQGYRY